jgi:hypothetical protein
MKENISVDEMLCFWEKYTEWYIALSLKVDRIDELYTTP